MEKGSVMRAINTLPKGQKYTARELYPVTNANVSKDRTSTVAENDGAPNKLSPQGQQHSADPEECAAIMDMPRGHHILAAREIREESKGVEHRLSQDHLIGAPSDLLAGIRSHYRQRSDLLSAYNRLELQVQSICRRAVRGLQCGGEKCGLKLCADDAKESAQLLKAIKGIKNARHSLIEIASVVCSPLLGAQSQIGPSIKTVEKELCALATLLPIFEWAMAIRGIGELSLVAIIAETGDLSLYDSESKVWKRMGLAVFNGERQRKVTGDGGVGQGYSPRRRSVMWNIGANFIRGGGPYKAMYDARKAYEMERGIKRGHAHRRAQRYIEKRFLKALWRAWSQGSSGEQPGAASQQTATRL